MRTYKRPGAATIGTIVLTACVLLALLVVGCSSAERDSSPSENASSDESGEMTVTELVRLSERKTLQGESARTTMTMTTASQNGMPAFQFSMEGVQDFESGDSLSTMSMPMFSKEIEVRTVGTMMYQKWPREMLAGSGVPAGKTWVSSDIKEQYREQTGVDLQSLQNQTSSSPTGQLEYLRSVGSAKAVGKETLRGVPTTHYRAVIDLDREMETFRGSAKDRDAFEAYYDELERSLGSSELPVDVWLDDRGRVHRYVMDYSVIVPEPTPDGTEMTAPQGQNVERAEVSLVMELYDYGVPVEVEAPPEQETISSEDALASQERILAG